MSFIRMAAYLIAASVISMDFASSLYAGGATLPPVRTEPRVTGVLLLPPLDTEPWSANVLPQRQLAVRQRAQYELIARGFKLYGEQLAANAANLPPKLDLNGASSRTEEVMDSLAKRSGARWVLSITVREVKEDPNSSGEKFHSLCDIFVQIWDASRHGWLANEAYIGRDEGHGSSPVWSFKESIDNAVRSSMEQILHDYPKVVTLSEVGSVPDYLDGQTEPFVGDPQTRFTGIKK